MNTVDLLLHGVGHVGRALLKLLSDEARCQQHGFNVRIVGAIDSRGGVWNPEGISPTALLAAKAAKGTVCGDAKGDASLSVEECLARSSTTPVLLESTLVDLATGGPGLAAMQAVLQRGGHAITANKGPLVVGFPELTALAEKHGGTISFSGTLGLPLLMVRHHLAHVTVERLEGIVNGTTNYILTQMTKGLPFGDALRQAQEAGLAEADPTLDISGWDAANKLIILANTLLHQPTTIKDVTVQGIAEITPAELQAATAAGEVIKLVISATRTKDGCYELSVGPRRIAQSHPLARLTETTVGLRLQTDINGEMMVSLTQTEPTPTAAAMVYDLIQLYGNHANGL
jgi:homoserine dehydrogenase